MMGELVLEIGTEEIPVRALPPAVTQLRERATALLTEARIPATLIESFATPRRLVLHAAGIPGRQEAQVTEVTGPPRAAAYDAQGKPTAAALGFAKSHGVAVEALGTKQTEKGEYLVVRRAQPALATAKVLAELLPRLIAELGFSKTMRWDGDGTRFARPIRWIVALFDGKTVAFRAAGLAAGNRSRGHRFSAPRPFPVKGWADFRRQLARHHVVLDPAERERTIRAGLASVAARLKGKAVESPALLQQAVFLTEDPRVGVGAFDAHFLSLPKEVLTTVMQEHQGYFAVENDRRELLPNFAFVSNVRTGDAGLIRRGNESVLRARLEDARFYFEQDQKRTLEDRIPQLDQLVFHDKLGTMADKTARLQDLVVELLKLAGVDGATIDRARAAARLSKTDLLTGTVREFPSLQGVMGREYALREKQDPEVATAIAEHYFPRGADDLNDPKTRTGKFLTAADRLDTLVGFFGAGLIPSGSEDPYGLRRQAIGLVMVTLDETFARLSLARAVEIAAGLYRAHGKGLKKDAATLWRELDRFLAQRMEFSLRRRFDQTDGFRPDLVEAVLARPLERPVDAYRRFVALLAFRRRPEFEPLMVTYRRASRIVPKAFGGAVRDELLRRPVERELANAIATATERYRAEMAAQRYEDALGALATLRPAIAAFFDDVMVMDQDAAVRDNRLALLVRVRDLFEEYADFTRLELPAAVK